MFYARVFLVIGCFLTAVLSQIEVTTKVGTIKGKTQTQDGVVHTFLGIPYAVAPVERARFGKPRKPDNFQFPYIANRTNSYCPQLLATNYVWSNLPVTSRSDEDCLYLNIYVPDNADNLGVMVFLEGDSFLTGRADVFDASNLAVKGNIIVVTVNYRLGFLGFASIGEPIAPGNMGLWDQNLALKWVQENIVAFGGDSNKVTLVGWSAGATSAALHALSEKSKGLFQRVILQGGAATGPTHVMSQKDASEVAKQVGIVTQCYRTDAPVSLSEMITCLKGTQYNPTRLAIQSLGSARRHPVRGFLNSVFVPVIDGDFIKDDPVKLLADKAYLQSIGFYDLDIMVGLMRSEGTLMENLLTVFVQPSLIPETFTSKGVKTEFMTDSALPAIIQGRFGEKSPQALEYVERKYNIKGTFTSYKDAFQTYTDAFFLAPIIRFARAHSFENEAAGKTFLYLFDHSAAAARVPAPHGGDLPYVFALNPIVRLGFQIPSTLNTKEEDYADMVVNYWSNFIKSGDPNIPESNTPVTWPDFRSGSEKFLKLTLDMSKDKSVGENIFQDRESFWLQCLPSILQGDDKPSSTCPAIQSQELTSTPLSGGQAKSTTGSSTSSTTEKATTPISTKPTTLSLRETKHSQKFTKTTVKMLPSSSTTDNEQTSPNLKTEAPKSVPQASTEIPGSSISPCNETQTPQKFLHRLGLDADTAETTIIALAAATGAFGLIALIVSCMLCAKKRKRSNYY